ncbi:rhodanese-like domain-containing protein [Flavobacterium sp. j3]|uniref:Rhodanese-like domain-containing protein n=1 Tax=Flavobacterium aureirubrum TaxID=3133147 RepID=A0ABU9N2Z1_9FLAO
MKSKIFLLFSISFLFFSCQGQQSDTIQTVDVKTFAEKLKTTENPQLVDVRTPEEYSGEHIENATNVNWNGSDFTTKVAKYDKSKPIFVYCKVGGRSSQAANKLAELGFKEIYNLDGGIMKWSAAGNLKPIEKTVGINQQEYTKLTQSSDRVMIDFNAKWCAPCKKMNPYILKFQSEMADKIKIVQLDADKNKTIVEQLKLDGLPVLIIYEKGKEVWRNVGYISEEDLKKHL